MLLNARSIALTDPGVGGTAGIYLAGLLERMGIAATIKPKVQWQKNGFFTAQAVAQGEAELGMTQFSEIVAVKGAVIAGPLPEPLQAVTTYCAGIFTASKAQDTARAFIDKLLSPALHARWKAAGFELPGSGEAGVTARGYCWAGFGGMDRRGTFGFGALRWDRKEKGRRAKRRPLPPPQNGGPQLGPPNRGSLLYQFQPAMPVEALIISSSLVALPSPFCNRWRNPVTGGCNRGLRPRWTAWMLGGRTNPAT